MMDERQLSYETALFKMAAYCSQSEHCISEVREKLNLLKISETEQNKIISYLIQEKYIDEIRFTRAYI
ncbi:hypothetical protein MASR2M117_25660 [Paludibacter sp.]